MKKTIKFLRTNRHSFFVSLIAIVLPILGSLLSLYIIFSYPEITEWIKDHSILFFTGTAFTMAILLTPTTFIASLSGFLFGLSSLVYVVPAYLLASLLGYIFGRHLDKGRLLKSMVDMDNKELLKNTVESNPFWFVILCRISPILPFGLMNLLLPAFGVKVKEFITAGTLGMLPRTILFVWLGSAAQNLLEALITGNGDIGFKFYMTAILVIVSSFGLIYLFKRKLRQLKSL
ncbi:TVP38/TMEM64 family protein [Poseidonibacter lekithochrous]|uniref:TVP38/TMEM64 family protein n=1 Tax=Poseidonibacter lekithochrous TaxID=1904463 RepID=UPI0009FA2E7F|nr:VTT domain-containing protein [Poseidonibacter lekithochrous]QKJ21666.1 DedA family membrane protein (SNARE domain) [Poseidonibacter lekithochrous]